MLIDSKIRFWNQMIEKLNSDKSIVQSIPEVLEDLCKFFGFGCGFIYRADYTGVFFLNHYFALYENNHLHDEINLEEVLGKDSFNEMLHEKVTAFTTNTRKNELQQKLTEVFNASSLVIVPIIDENGILIAFVGIVDRRGKMPMLEDDISFTYSILCTLASYVKLQLYQTRLETTQKSLESIMDNMAVDIYVNDFETHEILYANRSMAEPYGGIDNLMGKVCWDVLFDGKDDACKYCPKSKLLDKDDMPNKTFSWDYQRPSDEKWFRVMSSAFEWVDGRLAHVVSSVDITENKKNEEIVRQMAENDFLTGLPNQQKLKWDCDVQIKKPLGEDEKWYMVFFDLDGFKGINDTMGHRAGDEILVQVAHMLQENELTRGKSYRLYGDEFVILCDVETSQKIVEIIRFLCDGFSKNWALKDGEARCSASVGIASFPEDGRKTSELLHKSDYAMYMSKRKGNGLAHFYNKGETCDIKEYFAKLSEANS